LREVVRFKSHPLFFLRKDPLISIGQEAVWTPEAFQVLWRRENSFATTWN
jgi:hypothetical protein